MNEIKPGHYRHYKGNEYEVLFVAKHSETQEDMVVYRALYGDRGVWVRPAAMWNEIVERNGCSYQRFTRIESDHYLFEIRDFLRKNGLQYECVIDEYVKERASGKQYSFQDHLRALIYAQLSNQTKWSRIVPHLPKIDSVLFNYAPEKLKSVSPEELVKKLYSLKCGNRSTRAQMAALSENICTFERIENEYGSIDGFITSEQPHSIVKRLSDPTSPYKLQQVGEALAWEYIRNVGIDGAKPDTHIRRFLGQNRMGVSKGNEATIEEALYQIDTLAQETGLTKAAIDNLIWSFCADGYGEICTATPHCEICPLKAVCKHK